MSKKVRLKKKIDRIDKRIAKVDKRMEDMKPYLDKEKESYLKEGKKPSTRYSLALQSETRKRYRKGKLLKKKGKTKKKYWKEVMKDITP